MTRRSRIWLVAAALFVLINLGGAVYAVVMGELVPHATLHLVLLIPGVYVLSRLLRRRDASGGWRQESIPTQPGALTDRLTNLEQSVDAVAIEVERIGEGQRFMTKVMTESGVPRTGREGVEEPVVAKPQTSPLTRPDKS
jgi:hypothetical protein